MIVSHVKPAIRKALGNWLYSTINIVGLGIGLACCLLILLFVRHELSYESGFANAERIYRISREYFPIEGARACVPAQNNWPVADVLPQDFSGIELSGRMGRFSVAQISTRTSCCARARAWQRSNAAFPGSWTATWMRRRARIRR